MHYISIDEEVFNEFLDRVKDRNSVSRENTKRFTEFMAACLLSLILGPVLVYSLDKQKNAREEAGATASAMACVEVDTPKPVPLKTALAATVKVGLVQGLARMRESR